MTIGLNLPTVKTDAWKNKKCGQCRFQTRTPRDPGKPIDLKEPKILICRWGPPNIVFAIGQQANGQPVPMPMGAMYAMFDETHIACSQFEPILENSTAP